MPKESFWTKMKKEEKLKLVEPSEEVKESYIKKSESKDYVSRITNDEIKEARKKFKQLLEKI